MKQRASHRIDLALPIGMTLILSAVTSLLFPGIAAVGCELLVGLALVGICAFRKALRYAREKRADGVKVGPRNKWPLDRGDVLLLLAFAALYAGMSGFLLRAGWPSEAVRSCALFLLVISLLMKPRLTAAWKAQSQNAVPTDDSNKMSAIPPLDAGYPEITGKGRIQ